MATTDEILRTAAPQTDFEIRLFIGAKREMIATEDMALGEAFEPLIESVLTARVDGNSTTVQVADASRFTSRGFIVHPFGTHEAYEFFKWTNKSQTTFSGLTRVMGETDDIDVNWGVHSTGATVSEFIEISDRVSGMKLDFNEQDGAAFWTVRLDGRNYDSGLLDNDNSVAAQIRQRPYNGDLDAWSPWRLWWLGYIKKADISDDSTSARQWVADIEGISQYVSSTESSPKHYGKNDLAEEKAITVSSFLEDPYLEWNTGEFQGFPSLDGDQVNDGDLATLWMSEGEPSATPEEHLSSAVQINEIMLRPREGYNQRDHQWIELSFKRDDGHAEQVTWFSLTNKQTEWKRVDWIPNDPATGKPQDPPVDKEIAYVPDNNYIELKGGNMDPSGEFVILTWNYPKFIEKYPNHGAQRVLDVRDMTEGEFELDPTGDFLCLRNWHTRTVSIVWWSDGNPEWEAQAPYLFNGDDRTWWSGNMLPIPPRGHTFRRYPTGNAPDYNQNPPTGNDSIDRWKVDEDHPTPGYYTSGEDEWILVDLGEMGITLEEQLVAEETGTIVLSKRPLGLSEYGWVQINQEIIYYLNRNDDDNKLEGLIRGQDSTPISGHPADSIVKGLDTLDGTATTNHLISTVSWNRREVLNAVGKPIVLRRFDVYVSEFIDPVLPDADDWDNEEGDGGREDYWTTTHTVPRHLSPAWIGQMPPTRARHVLMIIREMTSGGRVKLNQWHVWADQVDLIEIPPGTDEEVKDVVDGAYSGAIIFDLLVRGIGLSPALFYLEDAGRPFINLTTASSNLLQLIKDICRRTGTSTVFNLDESVVHRFHPLYPLAGLETVDITWDRDNARRVSLTRPFRHNIKQVVIRAHESEHEENFEAKYPPTPLELGSTLEMEDWVLTDPNDAYLMAEYMFRQRNAPLTAVIVPVGPAEWVRPGQRHLINWDMDEGGEYLNRRNFVVEGVSWHLNFGGGQPGQKDWRTTVRLKELIF